MHMMLQHTVRLLLSLSCLQKQCMLEPNVEHLHIVHVIHAAVIHVPVVPEIITEQHATNKKRRSCRELMVSDLLAWLSDKEPLHWLLFQDNFNCSEELAFALPLLANGISGETSYVQLLSEFDSSGEHKGSSYTLHVKSVCLLVYTSSVSTKFWRFKRGST